MNNIIYNLRGELDLPRVHQHGKSTLQKQQRAYS